MSSRQFALKRIAKDYKEIQQNPVNGVGICQLDPNDPFQFLVNIKVMNGGYKDLIFHILLILPDQYPCKPPRMLILPGQPYDHSFHHHIYPEYDGYYKFCIDLLDKAIMDSSAVGSGWSPGYTFCTLLMQIQNFLADPDFSASDNKKAFEKAPQILKTIQSYSYTHKVGNQTFEHSTKKPYPPLQVVKQVEQADLKTTLQDQVKERISCFITKENIIDNPTGIYGYPLFVQRDKFNRLQQKPIPEILSLEGFKSQLDQYDIKGFNINHGKTFKTGMGEAYNAFLPVFLNKQHFQQSQNVLKECLTAISNSEYFEIQVLQVLPNLINKMIVALLNESMHQSISAIEAYIHFTQLFHFLVEDNASVAKEIDLRVKSMIQSDKNRSKQDLGDIGEFLVVLSASQYVLTPSLINVLYREYFARQIFWIPKSAYFNAYSKSYDSPQCLYSVFQSALISNKLLIFNIEASERFAEDKEYLNKLSNERYSVIPEDDAVKFIKETNAKIKNINTHVKLMEYLGLGDVYVDERSCYNLYKIAIHVSNNQRYTNFNLQLQNSKGPSNLQITGDISAPKISNLVLKSELIKQKKTQQKQETKKQQKPEQSKQVTNKIQIEEEEKVNNDKQEMEVEGEWHTVSNSKGKTSNQETKKEVVSDFKVQKQVSNTKPSSTTTVNKNQLVSKIANESNQTQQQAKTEIKNVDDDGWNVVSDKKKK